MYGLLTGIIFLHRNLASRYVYCEETLVFGNNDFYFLSVPLLLKTCFSSILYNLKVQLNTCLDRSIAALLAVEISGFASPNDMKFFERWSFLQLIRNWTRRNSIFDSHTKNKVSYWKKKKIWWKPWRSSWGILVTTFFFQYLFVYFKYSNRSMRSKYLWILEILK